MRQVLQTSGGQVEVVVTEGGNRWVLYFHGGHESAPTAAAAQLYRDLACNVLAVSRPGYGATDLRQISPAAFAPLVDEIRQKLGHPDYVAVVGTSFGGPQAVAYASRFPAHARSLILHSAAPSSFPYPDLAVQRQLGPLVFHPHIEGLVWKAVAWLIRTAPEFGLRLMAAPLSTEPVGTWLDKLSAQDRREMADVFLTMRSGSGYVTDAKYAGDDRADERRTAQQRVACPTLVTASRQDGGVAWRHAEDFAATIPQARLVEIPAPSHLFWIGPAKRRLIATISEFLDAY